MEKLLGSSFESVCGKSLEGVAQLCLGTFQQCLLLLCRLTLGLKAASDFRELVAECLRLDVVALSFRTGMCEAGLGFGNAAFLGFQTFRESRFLAFGRHPRDEPSEEEGDGRGGDEGEVGF